MEPNSLCVKNSLLFSGIQEEDLHKLCVCLSARECSYSREEFVFHAGDPVRSVYLVLSGQLHIIDEDCWGNRSIIETLDRDVLFGEAYVFSNAETLLVSVVAAEESTVLEINPQKLFETCANGCLCHATLVRNTLGIVSEKIVRLTEKLGHVMRRTTREKTLSYLSLCARRAGSADFILSYSRQQLADYLCVDRSALSHELSRLQKEGLLRYSRNRFTLLKHPDISRWLAP